MINTSKNTESIPEEIRKAKGKIRCNKIPAPFRQWPWHNEVIQNIVPTFEKILSFIYFILKFGRYLKFLLVLGL